MPKWLSSALITIGFLALVWLAFMPRNIEVNVTTNVDERGATFNNGGSPLHAPPASPQKEQPDSDE
ncbi:MAG: hypothetical protein R3C60_00375 [Parvularculaceae bacterium]